MNFDSVLLIGFGGPTPENACRCEPPCPSAAWCFVRGVLEAAAPGRPPDRERIALIVSHYELLGGYSPYNEHTLAQARALEEALRRHWGLALPVFVGMKQWTPWLADVLADMSAKGHRRALGVIMSPHQGAASWGRYQKILEKLRERAGPSAPEIAYLSGWWKEPGFIEAVADLTRRTMNGIPEAQRGAAALAFTNHSIPVSMAGGGDPYVRQFEQTAHFAARALGLADYALVYQSAPLPSRVPWLGPDIGEWIQGLPNSVRHAVAAPIGFLCDHVEVLYDLDVQARAVAEARGISFHRVPTVGTHPAFIGMLAERIAAMAGRG